MRRTQTATYWKTLGETGTLLTGYQDFIKRWVDEIWRMGRYGTLELGFHANGNIPRKKNARGRTKHVGSNIFLEKSWTTWARVNEVLCSTFDEIYRGVYAEARPPHALKCCFCNVATKCNTAHHWNKHLRICVFDAWILNLLYLKTW